MESYIEDKKYLYTSILEFLEGYDEYNYGEFNDEPFQNLIDVINKQQIEGNCEEMCQFLEIIKSIGDNHHRDQHFNDGINQILVHYKDQIKQTLSNSEIFHIFENNKKIVLFLFKTDIITISDEIYKEIINKPENNGNRYCHFFLPELEKYVGEEDIKFLKNELLEEDPNFFTNFDKKREEGENDSYICSLIRRDSVQEFISHMNRYNISPMSEISPSIFETNPFLIESKNTTLIEYSAFFGSIQIFRYLLMNKAELESSLWLYGIHSKNAELIHLLESNNVAPTKNYEHCLIESIKCHHNDIADYIENNLLNQNERDLQQNEEIMSHYIQYHNFTRFQNGFIIDHCFFYLCFYHYDKLVELLLTEKEKLIENKINKDPNIQEAIKNDDVEVIYHYLLKEHEISENLFKNTKIKQIAIPSSVKSIGNNTFEGCSSLTQITIPSSITSIRESAFSGCSSLTQITIPSSVTSIGDYAFSGCSSLTQITIPSSVTSIEFSAFNGCSSLTQITIPSSVTSIGNYAFFGCLSLTQITIPSSVTSIGDYTFSGCSSLAQITIPSSVTSIGYHAFYYCKLLTKITIPSSVTSIRYSAFKGCSSLTQITIPSSVTSIGDYTFSGCSSLAQITIPSSVTSIGYHTFYYCKLLTKITIPSSVTSIGKNTFSGCSSLMQILIPSTINIRNIGINSRTRVDTINEPSYILCSIS